jgi:hypothetical protein
LIWVKDAIIDLDQMVRSPIGQCGLMALLAGAAD